MNNPLPGAPAASPPAAATPQATAPPVVAPEPTPRVAPPVRQPQAATGEQAEFMTHYRTAMQHYARDRMLIVQAHRAVAAKAADSAELKAALDNLMKRQQASSLAMAKQDYAAGNQALQGMEDALTAIEKLTAN